MEKRRCETCEYGHEDGYKGLTCHFNPPQVSGDHQRGRFASTERDTYCSKWEPKWSDNPIIAEAWAEFKLVHKLITSGEEDD